MTKKSTIQITLQRVYDTDISSQGHRVLVDRLWPRGITKERLPIDEWCKDIAPSSDLRQWFAHEPAKWEMFRQRYIHELEQKRPELERLLAIARQKPLVLLYSAKDRERNQAVVIRDRLLAIHGAPDSSH